MGRLLLAGTLVVAAMGVAQAGPTRKVLIESEPPGATVYLNDVDKGPVCEATPCTIDAPIGTSTIILRLDKYEPEIDLLEVSKGKRPLQQKYTLKGAVGTIVVSGPKGAVIRIDEVDRGRAPARIDVSAEAHHVVIVMNKRSLYDDYVEVGTGEELVIEPKTASAQLDDDPRIFDDDDDSDGDGGGGSGSSGITRRTDTSPHTAYVHAAAAFDVGFRHFTYDQPQTPNLREESEGGQVIGGAALELWPGRLAGLDFLNGLSLFARAQLPVSGQIVVGGDLMGTVKAKWASYEVSLRQRWMFGDVGVEVSGGYVQDQFTFDATVGIDVDLMPDTRYQAVRLGGKVSYSADHVEPYLTAENRLVFSGGPVGERFADASVSGLRGSAGLLFNFAAFTARVEGTLMSYTWTFTYEPGAPYRASGATDSIKLISMALGYAY